MRGCFYSSRQWNDVMVEIQIKESSQFWSHSEYFLFWWKKQTLSFAVRSASLPSFGVIALLPSSDIALLILYKETISALVCTNGWLKKPKGKGTDLNFILQSYQKLFFKSSIFDKKKFESRLSSYLSLVKTYLILSTSGPF